MDNVNYYFEPETVAVVGASANPDKPGYTLLKNLIDSFDGPVYPVNPKQDEILGIECYSSVSEIPEAIDLVSILVPAPRIPDIVQECVEKDVKAIFVGSEGFADVSEEGAERQNEVVEIAEEAGARVWGPNCGGYLSSNPDLSNNFIMDTERHISDHLQGNVTFIAQSGMIAGGIYVEIITEDILDISKTLTIGNRADVAEPDLMQYLLDDDPTEVIGIYQESVKDGKGLMEALEAIAPDKPVVILKGGRSEIGAEAAQSHTGSIAGDDRVADAVFQQFGATRVYDFRQLLNMTKGFSMYPDGMDGNRIAILTMTGAGSVVASDLFAEHGLEPAELSEETKAALDEVYPKWMEPQNPVDIWLSITQLGIDETLTTSLEALMQDESVDGILLQALAFDYFDDFDFDAFVDIANEYDTPLVTWLVGEKDHTPYWIEHFEEGGLPVYRDMTACTRFLGAAKDYADWRQQFAEREVADAQSIEPAADVATQIDRVRSDDRTTLTEVEAKNILASWDIEQTHEAVATTVEEAVEHANEIGYPVVLKIVSPDIPHKSDIGGIALDLHDETAVRNAYDRVIDAANDYSPNAQIDGVLVQEMIDDGHETIIGIKNDPEFGPVVLFGLGGIFVEVLEDVALRAAPISEVEARQMIEEIQGYPVLTGARGTKPADVDALVDALVAVSELAVTLEDDIAELDINPLIVREEGKGVLAVDGLLELSE